MPPSGKRGNSGFVLVQILVRIAKQCDDRATISVKNGFAVIICSDSLAKSRWRAYLLNHLGLESQGYDAETATFLEGQSHRFGGGFACLAACSRRDVAV
ncbi:hypothetical protein [Sphingopyxis sp.]|uniref:hypothetical protein n=1 Tax=Sphingopyxis sp. TaxID=1908224 RepID=UPI003D0AFF1E